jgi:hypothetical protein
MHNIIPQLIKNSINKKEKNSDERSRKNLKNPTTRHLNEMSHDCN